MSELYWRALYWREDFHLSSRSSEQSGPEETFFEKMPPTPREASNWFSVFVAPPEEAALFLKLSPYSRRRSGELG